MAGSMSCQTGRAVSIMSSPSGKSELVLPKHLADRLRTIARKRRVSMARLVSDMLNDYARLRGMRGETHEKAPEINPTDTSW